ncbi:MAG: three-Cys-motif partner protein TcmP [Deltaproteobacteria bacterium]|nr:three-Cys-motif partner protein TcmP [Deltaproteobacteria bacterium]
MADNSFYEEATEQSQAKTAIVTKYFEAWAKVILPSVKQKGNKIAYLDLFAGRGRYEDETKSTPLLILEQAIKNPDLRDRLVTIFNDKDAENVHSLQREIDLLPGIEQLRYKPIVRNAEVGEQMVRLFEEMKLVPTLFFVDPWGYKGLSLRLINSVLKDWGCDAIFFFNYNRINMGLPNRFVEEPLNALFGEERASQLRAQLVTLTTEQRELAIVEAIGEALKAMGGTFVLPFRFRNAAGTRTSHHLIFVSKHVRGYKIMKDIMAKESSSTEQGVPSFEYNPALRDQGLLFELSRPLDELAGMLLQNFAGQSLTMKQIFERHHIGRRFIERNYKDVLLKLEADGKIVPYPPSSRRRKNSFADTVQVTFFQRG